MSKSTIHFNDYVSLAVMLLMVVALIAGQADASTYADGKDISIAPIATLDNRTNIDLEARLSEQALKVSIAIVTDLSHFRGEDE